MTVFYNKFTLKLLMTVLIFSISFCDSSKATSQKVHQRSKSTYWNEVTEFYAGTMKNNKNRFYKLTQTGAYRYYKKAIDSIWDKIVKHNVTPITKWRNKHIKQNKNTVFYPLSGADFINAYNFYPNSEKYIMIALEPPGKILNPLQLSKYKVHKIYRSIRYLTWQISKQNYYTRMLMRREFKNPYLMGIAPIILLYMSRLGLYIDNFEKVEMDSNGYLHKTTKKVNELKQNHGIRITFFKQNKKCTLVYLRMYINKNSADYKINTGKFFNRLGRLNTILKSAEYILQLKKYTAFNSYMIKNSDIIIQDDSGFPYSMINEKKWDIGYYGMLKKRFRLKGTPNVGEQWKLIKRFKAKAKPLPFHFGYGVLLGGYKSNLVVMHRLTP